MSSAGKSSVSYLCPHCQAKLSAHAGDAGQRRECPRCGKRLKVPGSASGTRQTTSTSTGSRPAATVSGNRKTQHAVICPLCGTRLYASQQQIGSTIVCPDCLESVVVPAPAPPRSKPAAPPASRARPQPPSAASDSQSPVTDAAEDKAAASDDSDDELRLSDPIDLPRHRTVSGHLADLLDQHITDAETVSSSADRSDRPKGPVILPSQFAVRCPVCDTMLQVTPDEIGSKKKCPDCFSPVEIKQPPPKRQRVNPVVEADYANDNFVLSEPAPREVFDSVRGDGPTRSLGEEALRKAWREQAEKDRDTLELPLTPLWTGVFDFLADPTVLSRIVGIGLMWGISVSLALKVAQLLMAGDPGSQFFGIIGGIILILLGAATVIFTSVNLLAVLLVSAEGSKKIDEWPENSPADWITDSFGLLMALFFAALPGIVMVASANMTGMSLQVAWILVGASLYLFFPITQLSILESASLTNPTSRPIIDSLRKEFLLWCTFYIISFFLSIAVAIAVTSLRPEHSTVIYVAAGIFLAFIGFLYFRWLGRLAWTCQVRPLQNNDTAEQEETPAETDPPDTTHKQEGVRSGKEQRPRNA